MSRTTAGLLLAAIFALACYVGPSEAGSMNLTAADCAASERCYR